MEKYSPCPLGTSAPGGGSSQETDTTLGDSVWGNLIQRISYRRNGRAEELHGTGRSPLGKQHQQEGATKPRAGGTGRRRCYQNSEARRSWTEKDWKIPGSSWSPTPHLLPVPSISQTQQEAGGWGSLGKVVPVIQRRQSRSGEGQVWIWAEPSKGQVQEDEKIISRHVSMMEWPNIMLQTWRSGSFDSVPSSFPQSLPGKIIHHLLLGLSSLIHCHLPWLPASTLSTN